LLVFKKEDWATFFRFNLIAGLILLVDSIGEISSGEFDRAQSLVGNPTFLAGYFLFVRFSAITAFFSSRRGIWWKVFSFLMIFGGILGGFPNRHSRSYPWSFCWRRHEYLVLRD